MNDRDKPENISTEFNSKSIKLDLPLGLFSDLDMAFEIMKLNAQRRYEGPAIVIDSIPYERTSILDSIIPTSFSVFDHPRKSDLRYYSMNDTIPPLFNENDIISRESHRVINNHFSSWWDRLK